VLLFRPPVWNLSSDHNPQSTRIAEGAQVNMDRDERGDDDKAHVMDEMRQNQHDLFSGMSQMIKPVAAIAKPDTSSVR